MSQTNGGMSSLTVRSGWALLTLSMVASLITVFVFLSGKSDIFELYKYINNKIYLSESSSACSSVPSDDYFGYELSTEEIKTIEDNNLEKQVYIFRVKKPELERTIIAYDLSKAGQFAIGKSEVTGEMVALLKSTEKFMRSKTASSHVVAIIGTQDAKNCKYSQGPKTETKNFQWQESCSTKLAKDRADSIRNVFAELVYRMNVNPSKLTSLALKVYHMDQKRTYSQNIVTRLVAQRGFFLVFDRYNSGAGSAEEATRRKESVRKYFTDYMSALGSCISSS